MSINSNYTYTNGVSVTIVLYHPEHDIINLWDGDVGIYWKGSPYCVWNTLEIAFEKGWEVIGEL